jgi:hypothetical protein
MDQEIHCHPIGSVAEHVHEPRLHATSIEAADYLKHTGAGHRLHTIANTMFVGDLSTARLALQGMRNVSGLHEIPWQRPFGDLRYRRADVLEQTVDWTRLAAGRHGRALPHVGPAMCRMTASRSVTQLDYDPGPLSPHASILVQ